MEIRLKSRLQSHKQIPFLTYLILVIGFQGLQVGVWWEYQSMSSRVVVWSAWFSCASGYLGTLLKYTSIGVTNRLSSLDLNMFKVLESLTSVGSPFHLEITLFVKKLTLMADLVV